MIPADHLARRAAQRRRIRLRLRAWALFAILSSVLAVGTAITAYRLGGPLNPLTLLSTTAIIVALIALYAAGKALLELVRHDETDPWR